MTARSNPLTQQQPSAQLVAVEESLRQGLGGVASECKIEVRAHEAGGRDFQLFFVKAFGEEWHFDAAMSVAAAYSTGQSVARMVIAAGEKKRKAEAAHGKAG